MKKFRLFTLLALVASLTTVFAAWELYLYPDKFISSSENLTIEMSTSNIVDKGEISVGIEGNLPTVRFDNFTTTVSGDINVKVTASQEETIDDYKYYYVLVGPAACVTNVNSLIHDEPITIESISEMDIKHEFVVDADGNAVITGDELASKMTFVIDEDAKDSVASLESELQNIATYLQIQPLRIVIYAEKIN